MSNFHIKKDMLIFESNGKEEKYRLPYPQSKLEGVPAFLKDLNFKAERMDLTADKIKVSKHYVYLDGVRIKFPSRKTLPVYLSDDIHKKVKVQSQKIGLTMGDYVGLCVKMCESDVKS